MGQSGSSDVQLPATHRAGTFPYSHGSSVVAFDGCETKPTDPPPDPARRPKSLCTWWAAGTNRITAVETDDPTSSARTR